VPNGSGFFLSPELASSIIIADQRNKEVIFPFLIADDVNGDYEQTPSRWIINFFRLVERQSCRICNPVQYSQRKGATPFAQKSKDKNYRRQMVAVCQECEGMYVGDRQD